MKLSMIAMMIFAACAASSSSNSDAKEPAGPWRVGVETSGGFTGKGTGSFAIDSNGQVTVKSMRGRTCTYTATDAERARFAQLIANAKPNAWAESYAPKDNCCDRIQYDLTLDLGGTQKKTTWVDDPAPMPQDLAALVEAITGGPKSLRVVYQGQCS